MRVIAGEQKGLTLKAVPGHKTRPTTDKVKEAIFNMIGPFFDGGIGLDLYGGSGGLGIEALSRGVERMIFVDQQKRAIETIKQNLSHCGLEGRAEVYRNDAKRALQVLTKRGIVFAYVFLDPPYAKQTIKNDLAILANHGLLEEGGVVVCEHDRDTMLPDQIEYAVKHKEETYGDTMITIYKYEKGGNLE
ncbi:16S rRNA (guanine(966)-N(2))-methyltransferase RsmD [Halalkalibacterium halodurans]|uniref:BH2590 protein n=1 Tax=Halalkalibacterium halodurans (strain ATCC BAA-125 / DSM 18197 / FERM 7344 / JCM 9153 / C-125) TaxID=272558 RepID=Q9K9Q5_HALH5|nr:16S rRNA (guanine(966)-N(2))-methyltransferase RsmD [Halalkalibacterium halodurans]MED3647267.1 16S rRNA (guanine(966)-N(2))-methyltransferase RsmD [Halalkalibacterium halodurans]MED4079734.1 16S rRNA (guanine(966)-N(2))-methyltransferase RsmD [Halalkalibacterium halodurans]MED4086324.1 16S rRNA (guanine(966)-N(2))-methyltransferase RsmD [Halalkalibacterium halodurans]MED4103331.1 16S rRNA (guanine(966)-N(2))-methyltransferase RsmD [Halalkalibacterium halodurans]MED4107972.1 16S rRNA (guani